MPRSTSGIAVSIARLFVTLPSSFSLLFFDLSNNSAYGSTDASSVSSSVASPRRSFMFSSIYANLIGSKEDEENARDDETHICLSTSSAFVCFVKLFVLTTFLALASASPSPSSSSITTTFFGFFFVTPLLSFVISMPVPVLRSLCSSSNSEMLMRLNKGIWRVESGNHSL